MINHIWIPRDPGEAAIRDWVRQHWRGNLRARWLDHLEGRRYWVELPREDFGRLAREFPDPQDQALLARVLERVRMGHENLQVLTWALDSSLALDTVARVLTAIDVNGTRLLATLDHTPKSAALERAERILRDGHTPADLLPIPQHLRDAAERDLGTKPVPPGAFWKSLIDAALRHHYAGQRLVTKRLPKGVIVLAVGEDEVNEFLAHIPADMRVGTATEPR